MSDRRTAIVMAYYEREALLRRTLETIEESKHDNYFIVVVDDASPTPLPKRGIHVIRVEQAQKRWKSVVAWNIGLQYALHARDLEIVLVQNPECYHVGDVLMHANDHVSDNYPIAFGCWALSEQHTGKPHDIFEIIKQDDPWSVGGTGWYNHPKWNPRAYNFCSAFTAHDMRRLNGFDERLAYQIGHDDNDLVRRTNLMGGSFTITGEAEPFVVHQFHHRPSYPMHSPVYDEMRKDNGYRAVHLETLDFPGVEEP